jgi:hypothetical protein
MKGDIYTAWEQYLVQECSRVVVPVTSHSGTKAEWRFLQLLQQTDTYNSILQGEYFLDFECRYVRSNSPVEIESIEKWISNDSEWRNFEINLLPNEITSEIYSGEWQSYYDSYSDNPRYLVYRGINLQSVVRKNEYPPFVERGNLS